MEKAKKDDVTKIADYLKINCPSEKKAIYAGDLSRMFNCDKRELRNKVNHLRCHGHPICSGQKGYWYSEDTADITATIEGLTARIKGMTKAIVSLKKFLQEKEAV